ncbi:MAG: bifunctional UDP-N-acetylglucosamine diphosphorylase/glucosamine-1-phosphate N-acetyltransferase GlmU [Proteobacteria bacterium]|nr:bifunctional UDP-N-acetylglucosamine diphosphorylase/glucosamine-1-phosphate N-acetyltransferase GlmU [Pseudomonadota bacterium]
MKLNVVVLAAGQGKRMHSDLPKVLHPLAGRSLLGRVVDTARALEASKIVIVYGHGGEQVRTAFANDTDLAWAEQEEQLGTGHAVMQALPLVDKDAEVLVLYGDVPLIRAESLHALVKASHGGLGIMTAVVADASGYGRIVRDGRGRVLRIVEHKDANEAERAIREWNTGFLASSAARLSGWLSRVKNENAQKEYYLTDVIALAVADGLAVKTTHPAHVWEVEGVNSRRQLAELERIHQREVANGLLEQGVALADPARFDVRGTLACGRDVAIDVNCVFEGTVRLGDRVKIGPNCVLKNVTVAADTQVNAYSLLEEATVGANCRIGPYARLRPGAALADEVHIGNFVEVKNSRIGKGSKSNHLAYVGDSDVGSKVNIGAGTITCNYDGVNKSRTVIEDGVFVGSNATLVAPVTIAKDSYIGAGSTISKDTPPGQLTVARSKQVSIPSWKPPKKKG